MGTALKVNRGGGASEIANGIIKEYLSQTESISANTFVEFCGGATQLDSVNIKSQLYTSTYDGYCNAVAIDDTHAVLFFNNSSSASSFYYAISLLLTDTGVSVINFLNLNNVFTGVQNQTSIYGVKVTNTNYIVAARILSNYQINIGLFFVDPTSGIIAFVSQTTVTYTMTGLSQPTVTILELSPGKFLLEVYNNSTQFCYLVFKVSNQGVVSFDSSKVFTLVSTVNQGSTSTRILGAINGSKVILISTIQQSTNLGVATLSVFNIADDNTITEDTTTRIPLTLGDMNTTSTVIRTITLKEGKEFLILFISSNTYQIGTTGVPSALYNLIKVTYDSESNSIKVSKTIHTLNFAGQTEVATYATKGKLQKIDENRVAIFMRYAIQPYSDAYPIYYCEAYISGDSIHFSEPMLLDNLYDRQNAKNYCLCGRKLLLVTQDILNTTMTVTISQCIITTLQLSDTKIKTSESAIDGVLQSIATTTKKGKVSILKGD